MPDFGLTQIKASYDLTGRLLFNSVGHLVSLLYHYTNSDGRNIKIGIVFEKVVEHVDAEVKHCPTCDTTVKGQFPSDFHGSLQYGEGLKTFVVDLLVCQMVAMNRVQKLVKSMMGVVLHHVYWYAA